MSENQQSQIERIATLEANYKTLIETVRGLVTRAEFTPVKLIAYGLISIMGLVVITAVLGHVLIH
jgi:hypothetical protein